MAEEVKHKFSVQTGESPIEKEKRKKGSKEKYLFGRLETGTPDERLNTSKGWIDFGKKNDYPQELLRLYQNADPLHTKLLNKNIDMIASQGWKNIPALADFLQNEIEGCHLNKVARECAFNQTIFGGFYLNCVWSADGSVVEKIKSIPFEKVRIGIPCDPTSDKIDSFYISRNWLSLSKKENEPVKYLAFDAGMDEEALERRVNFPSQILFVRTNPAGLDWYVLAPYSSLINQVKLSYEMWNYQLKSAQRGYQPNMIVSIPNVPGEEQQIQISQDLKNRGGTDEVADTVCLFAEDSESLPKFEVLNPSTNDKKYLELIDKVQTIVYIGDNTNNVVADVAIQNKLGNNSEVIEQYQMHQATVINPSQKEIEEVFNLICKINKLPEEMKLESYVQYMQKATLPSATENEKQNDVIVALSSLSPLLANKVLESMSQDEIRAIIGLSPSITKPTTEQQTNIE